jgi:hypothetical protein
MKKARYLLLIMVLLVMQSDFVALAKKKKKAPIVFSSLDNLMDRDFFLQIDQANFSQDITNAITGLTISYDPRSIAVANSFPHFIKIEVYKYDDSGNEVLLSVINQSFKKKKHLKPTVTQIPLPSLVETSNIIVKVFDSNSALAGRFETSIEIQNNSDTASNITESQSDCDEADFGQCQMDYIVKNLNIVGINSKDPATVVTRERTGKFIARVPLVAQGRKRVKSKIKIRGAVGGGTTLGRAINFENSNDKVKAQMGWDESTDSLKITFPGSDRSFSFSEEGLLNITKTGDSSNSGNKDDLTSLLLQDGDENQVPIQIERGTLSTNLVDGAIEYDGSKLYFTSGNKRYALGSSSTVINNGGGGPNFTASGPNDAILLNSSSNSAVSSSALEFVSGSLRVSNAIVFQSLNSETFNGVQNINWTTGNQKRITLDGNTTLTFTAPAGFGSILLEINQDVVGGRTITWPGNVLWSDGSAPVLSTAANAIDVVTCFYNGTNYLCQAGLNFQ